MGASFASAPIKSSQIKKYGFKISCDMYIHNFYIYVLLYHTDIFFKMEKLHALSHTSEKEDFSDTSNIILIEAHSITQEEFEEIILEPSIPNSVQDHSDNKNKSDKFYHHNCQTCDSNDWFECICAQADIDLIYLNILHSNNSTCPSVSSGFCLIFLSLL